MSHGVIDFYTIATLFASDMKLIKRGENALRSGHLQEFMYDAGSGVAKGTIHASMKDKTYKVEVRYFKVFNFHTILSLHVHVTMLFSISASQLILSISCRIGLCILTKHAHT